MSYVQIRYSGFVLSGGKELQGLTPSGIGTGTQLDYIQIHNSSDGGIEIFGGSTHLKYLVLTGNADDTLDTDVGFRGPASLAFPTPRTRVTTATTSLEPATNCSPTPRPPTEPPRPPKHYQFYNYPHI